MPHREPTMIDVKEVLRRWQAGHSARKIDEETGTDRKCRETVPTPPAGAV